MQRLTAKNQEEQERRTQRFNVVQQIAYIHGNREKEDFTMLKLGLHKREFILTLRNEIFKNTPEPPSQPIVRLMTNMSHILQ